MRGARCSGDTGRVQPLSLDLDDPDAQPYFIWDVPITVAELRQRLRHHDPAERALWMGRVLREARYADVWKFLDVHEVDAQFDRISKHLGRSRAFWEWLLEGWRQDGLLGPRPH